MCKHKRSTKKARLKKLRETMGSRELSRIEQGSGKFGKEVRIKTKSRVMPKRIDFFNVKGR